MEKTIEAKRQGELLFIKVDNCPDWVKTQLSGHKDLGKVIREGEVSGHKHEIEGAAVLVENKRNTYFYNNSAKDGELHSFNIPPGDMFLTVDNNIKIVHPEHKTLNLSKGTYVVRIQREYAEDGERNIMD